MGEEPIPYALDWEFIWFNVAYLIKFNIPAKLTLDLESPWSKNPGYRFLGMFGVFKFDVFVGDQLKECQKIFISLFS